MSKQGTTVNPVLFNLLLSTIASTRNTGYKEMLRLYAYPATDCIIQLSKYRLESVRVDLKQTSKGVDLEDEIYFDF